MSYVSSLDDFRVALDSANGATYENIPAMLKKELQEHITAATESLDEVSKEAINQAAKETLDAIDKVSSAENMYVPSPKLWESFKENELTHIHETLTTLENRENKNDFESGVDCAIGIIKSFHDATEKLGQGKDNIQDESKDMKKMLVNLNNNILALNAVLMKTDNSELLAALNDIKKNSQESINMFSQIYSANQQNNRSFRTVRAKEILLSAKDTMKSYGDAVQVYLDYGKTCLQNKKEEVLHNITSKVSDIAKKTTSFMSSLKQKLTRTMEKGKEAYETVKNLRISITPYDKRDMSRDTLDGISHGMLAPMTANIVEEIAKSGFDNNMATKAIDKVAESFKATLTEVASKDKYQKMFKENGVAMAR